MRSQHTGAVLFVREMAWRGTSTDKLICDEFLDLEYKDIEDASPASMLLKNALSSYAPSVGDEDLDVVVGASNCWLYVDDVEPGCRIGEGRADACRDCGL